MEEAISVAISAWPIVFAAVVAQCLKTWATHRVERGIKLVELEQLLGANSVGSAFKQPLVLHRIGYLTLIIFGLWCFSPLGSQVLQHVYDTEYRMGNNVTTGHFVNMLDSNFLFSPTSYSELGKTNYTRYLQEVIVTYQTPFTEIPPKDYTTDMWSHPIVQSPYTARRISNLGVPVFFDNSVFDYSSNADEVYSYDALSASTWEKFSFFMPTSMINFTCDQQWSQKKGSDFMKGGEYEGMYSSTSQTLLVSLNSSLPYSVDSEPIWDTFRLASMNDPTNARRNDTGSLDPNVTYSFIQCTMSYVTLNINVTCSQTSSNLTPDCETISDDVNIPQVIEATPGIGNISYAIYEWVSGGEPYTPTSYFETTLSKLTEIVALPMLLLFPALWGS
jgi:hypothetical protein